MFLKVLRLYHWSLVAGITAVIVFLTADCSLFDQSIPRDMLIADVQQLAEIIRDAHPAPYERCGGKDIFDAKLAEIIAGIPEKGMRRSEFTRHLMPFVAFVGDAHTVIHADFETDYGKPGGIPLYFGVVGEDLYVQGVTREEEQHLIGARLVSVENVPITVIADRLPKLRAVENKYGALAWLGRYGDLWCEPQLTMLLPEWTDHSNITVELVMPEGKTEIVTFDLPRRVSYPPIMPRSTVTMPSVNQCDFAYSFLDQDKQVALLRITGMMHYREALEMWEADGSQDMRRHGRKAYKKFRGRNSPSNYDEVIAGVPSVTETFRDLVIEMKKAGTETLLIDVRENSGGNSYMSNILVYYLFGKEKLLGLPPGLEIKKYSNYYLETYSNIDLGKLNEGRDVPLMPGDCDTVSNPGLGVTSEIRLKRLETLRKMTTFAAELESAQYSGFYKPENVVVLSTPWTFSSGYTMMRHLYRAGAKLAGTPSGQASNCFGDILHFELVNSKISGSVSHKRFMDFPDDPALDRILPMDYPLTYDRIREYGFDPNAEVRWGIEISHQSNDN